MWTGDLEFFELLREPIEAALRWIDEYGDLDGDGFVEYRRRSRAGLENQGWRDARDAIVHSDGTAAEGPIALAESQAYVYYAKRRLASLFGQLGDVELSERLQAESQALKLRFNERFWMDDEGYVAMALDGDKRQVQDDRLDGRPLPLVAHRRRGARAGGGRAPAVARHVLGLGRAHHGQVGARAYSPMSSTTAASGRSTTRSSSTA